MTEFCHASKFLVLLNAEEICLGKYAEHEFNTSNNSIGQKS